MKSWKNGYFKNVGKLDITIYHKPWCVHFENLISHLNTQAKHDIIQGKKSSAIEVFLVHSGSFISVRMNWSVEEYGQTNFIV